ncbi:MAG: lytic murein transglycosylase [Chloroflexota bacterium]
MNPIIRHNLSIFIYVTIVAAFAVALSTVRLTYSSFVPLQSITRRAFFKPVIDKLLERGADTAFISRLMLDPETRFDGKYIKINVTGYLNKANYSQNYSQLSIERTKKFLERYSEDLEAAQELYGVPKEIIASILWVETKHGNYLGAHHLPSVFLSAALADRPEYIALNIAALHENFKGDSAELPAMEEKIRQRAIRKAEWALNELLAMSELESQLLISFKDVRGSWAGAFGLPQFLPSSFKRWAVDGDRDGIIDLFSQRDAIFSVGNYLKSNGWVDSVETSRKKAIFHYNNSADYVDAVMKLAQFVTPVPDTLAVVEPIEQ